MKKVMKRTVIIIGLLLIAAVIGGSLYFKKQFFSTSPSELVFEDHAGKIPFLWASTTHENFKEEHNAMLIPVKVPGIDYTFYMQFDLGAQSSILYYNPLQSFEEKGIKLKIEQEKKKTFIKDFKFTAGDYDIHAKVIHTMNYGTPIDWENPKEYIIIGTIGADLIDQRICTFDFPNQRIQFFENIPTDLTQGKELVPFTLKGRRYLFPAQVNGKEGKLFYDTGSSPFGLITTAKKYKKLADKNAIAQSFNVNSWGSPIPVHNIKSMAPITIGGVTIPLQKVSYFESGKRLQNIMMRISGVRGMLGNKTFLNAALLLDNKQGTFLVLPSTQKQ